MSLASKNLFIVILTLMMHAGCLTVTGVTYVKIINWKKTLQYFIKESPTMPETVKHFALINTRMFDDWVEILLIGLILGAILMSMLIFLGGMAIFRKGNKKDEKSNETIPAELEEEEPQPSGGCFLKRTFGGLFRYETTLKEKDIEAGAEEP